MKKIIVSAFIAMTAFACKSETPQANLRITGNIEGIEQGSALIYLDSIADKYVDSTHFEKGTFTLTCNLETPQQVMVFVKDTAGNSVFMGRIFADKGEITVKGKPDFRKAPQIENAPLHEQWQNTQTYVKNLAERRSMDSLNQLINRHYLAGEKQRVNELNLERNILVNKIIDSIFAQFDQANSHQVAAFMVCEYASSLPLDEQIAIAGRFAPNFTNSFYLNQFKKEIEKEKRLSEGCKAPDFKVMDLQGNEYTLANFKGKYLFLEFSASWCGWCKKEIPFVRDAYMALKDKNIVFVTMNMDTTREKWEGDVTKENIEWLCLSNLEGMKSALASSYNIHGIPACFVIDPEGAIIKRDIRGKEVKEYLSGLVKQ